MKSSGRFYKVAIPRRAGLEDSYVHSHHPNVLSEAMARIFVAGIHVKCATKPHKQNPTATLMIVHHDLKAPRFLSNPDA